MAIPGNPVMKSYINLKIRELPLINFDTDFSILEALNSAIPGNPVMKSYINLKIRELPPINIDTVLFDLGGVEFGHSWKSCHEIIYYFQINMWVFPICLYRPGLSLDRSSEFMKILSAFPNEHLINSLLLSCHNRPRLSY